MADDDFAKLLEQTKQEIHQAGLVGLSLNLSFFRTWAARNHIKGLERINRLSAEVDETIKDIELHELRKVISNAKAEDVDILKEFLHYYLTTFDLHLFIKAELAEIENAWKKGMSREEKQIAETFCKGVIGAMSEERKVINALNAELKGNKAEAIVLIKQHLAGHKTGLFDMRKLRNDFKEIYSDLHKLRDALHEPLKTRLTPDRLKKLETLLSHDLRDIQDIIKREGFIADEVLKDINMLDEEYGKGSEQRLLPHGFVDQELQKHAAIRAVIHAMLESMQKMELQNAEEARFAA